MNKEDSTDFFIKFIASKDELTINYSKVIHFLGLLPPAQGLTPFIISRLLFFWAYFQFSLTRLCSHCKIQYQILRYFEVPVKKSIVKNKNFLQIDDIDIKKNCSLIDVVNVFECS